MSELEIWKFPLPVIDMPVIDMPAGAKVLTVAMQRDTLCVWATVDPNRSQENRWFCVRGTGHTMTGAEGDYIGTVMLEQGALVFHVFEAKP